MRKIKPKKAKEEMTLREPRLIYPSFYIGIEHLPEAKQWKIGNTYYLTLEVKQTGLSLHKDKNEKERGDANFDITGIEILKKRKNNKELPSRE